jgi:hypothetical protein
MIIESSSKIVSWPGKQSGAHSLVGSSKGSWGWPPKVAEFVEYARWSTHVLGMLREQNRGVTGIGRGTLLLYPSNIFLEQLLPRYPASLYHTVLH